MYIVSVFLALLVFNLVLAEDVKQLPSSQSVRSRGKRSATGALHIVTNNAQPIHADVKSEGDGSETTKIHVKRDMTELGNFQPCPDAIKPSHIETGVGFKVTPPEDATYAMKSLRKSAPLQIVPPTALDLLRSITRVVTFIIVFISAVCEFYSTFQGLIHTVSNFIST